MAREGPTEKGTLSKILKQVRDGTLDCLGKSATDGENSRCKYPEAEASWA